MIPLFLLPFTLSVVLASSTSGDQHFCEIVSLCRPQPHKDSGRAGAAGKSFARDKELGPKLGEIIIRPLLPPLAAAVAAARAHPINLTV